jgi:Protein of Unknown function (DUF2784)
LANLQTRKNRLFLRGAVGVWDRESGDHIKGCDGAWIHAISSLAGAGGWNITNVAAFSVFPVQFGRRWICSGQHSTTASAFPLRSTLISHLYSGLATVVLLLHALFIVWVIFGAFLTRSRPLLRWLHIASLVWGIVIEFLPWPCPLTLLENWLEGKAGLLPYQGQYFT